MSDPDHPATPPERRYKAFVSYSYADRIAGERLFRIIDGYRPPRALRGRETPLGPVPDKLYPCFRDREEEGTAGDIRAEVERALAVSDNLVVLCSATSAKSQWVAYEIETFAKLGKASRIHAIILDGEPQDVFPPALAAAGIASPLAADLRTEGDGWTDGPLKLIAGLIGVPYGELRDRERQRGRERMRRLVGIAGGFVALLVLASCAGWVALDRSDRLQDAFVSALEKSTARIWVLTGPGSQKMTTAQIGREIDEVRGLTDLAFALAPDTPKLLEEQAMLQMVYSGHYLLIGKTEDARKAAARAQETWARLDRLGGVGADKAADHEADQAVAYGQEADALLAAGNSAAARVRYDAVLARLEDIRKRHPDNEPTRLNIAVTHAKLGDIARSLGEKDEAKAHFETSRDLFQALDAARPSHLDYLRNLSITYDRLADFADDPVEVRRLRQAAYDARAKILALDTNNPRAQRDLADAVESLGDLDAAGGDAKAANKRYESSLKVYEKLVAADPGNLEYQRAYWTVQMKLGALAQQTGNPRQARTRYEAALKIVDKTAAAAPTNVVLQGDMMNSLQALGDLALQRNDKKEARRRREASLRIMERLCVLDPANVDFQRALYVAHFKIANLKGPEAKQHWQAAYDTLLAMKKNGTMQPNDEQFIPVIADQLAEASK